MASTMRYWKSGAEPLMRTLLLLTAMLPGLLWAESIVIQQVETRQQDNRYLLDATIHFEFNKTVLEALEHGVPLTIELQLQVARIGAWFWEPDVVSLQRYRVLRFHALTQLYEIQDLEHNHSQSFATRDIAIAALGEIHSLPVADRRQLAAGVRYEIKIRASLDIESLPLTLRPLAYLTPDWNLSSRWRRYPL